jgi:DNA-binding winged helix-turn-helix (wHTH) protein
VPRYRFDGFVVSPRRRLLLEDGRERALIPRYFDLLVFLIEHRHEAVHRRDIFERVWGDVIVSDSALTQAVRTLRRTLGDDTREPRYIRTVSRHGYRFVHAEVVEEEDNGTWPAAAGAPEPAPAPAAADTIDTLLDRISGAPANAAEEEEQREAAELLHTFGIAEALRRLGTRPGHERARALLRDVRWDSPAPAAVPLLGAAAPVATSRALIALRLHRAGRLTALRWEGAAVGAALAGALAGAAGGLILAAAPGSNAPAAVAAVLAAIGATCGALAGAGVGAGLALAEAVARSARGAALVAGGALGGLLVGAATQWIAGLALTALVGLRIGIGGALEGLTIGAAAGVGYALATRRAGGLAAPRGGRRLRVAVITATLCAAAALAVTAAGRPLIGGTIHEIAEAAEGSQAVLTPLGRLIGEPGFGPISRAVIGAGEGALFGLGLALGLTRRPKNGA